MTAVQISQRLSTHEIDLTHPDLGPWVKTMQSRLPRSLRELTQPKWLGMFCDGKLFAAISFVHRDDGSIFIDGLVCRPQRFGKPYALALWCMLTKIWKGKKISFCVSTTNRKMLRALGVVNAKPVAILFEGEI